MTVIEIFTYILIVAGGLFIGIGLPCAIIREKQRFNNGICPICGQRLEHFNNDSQDVRGYCCPSIKHKYYTWVSYKFIDKNFDK